MLNQISTDPYVQGVFIVAISLVLIVFRLVLSENRRATANNMERLQKEFEGHNARIYRLEQLEPNVGVKALQRDVEAIRAELAKRK